MPSLTCHAETTFPHPMLGPRGRIAEKNTLLHDCAFPHLVRGESNEYAGQFQRNAEALGFSLVPEQLVQNHV